MAEARRAFPSLGLHRSRSLFGSEEDGDSCLPSAASEPEAGIRTKLRQELRTAYFQDDG